MMHKYKIRNVAMYLQNKYTQCYFNIIEKAKSRELEEYTEHHHIIPKSLGGSNHPENLVRLTAREHFICHWLLTKMVTPSPAQKKLFYAFSAFAMISLNQKRIKITGKKYEILRKARSESAKGHKPFLGKVRTADSKKAQSQTMQLKYESQEYIHHGKTYEEIYGKDEAERRKNKLKGPRGPRKNPPGPQKLITCPFCQKIGGISNMKRYHFDNCANQYGDVLSQV